MNLNNFMRKHRLIPADIIPIVQQVCPRFDKQKVSMCIHEDYGVTLSAKASKALKEYYEPRTRYAPKPKTRISVMVDSENVEEVRKIIAEALKGMD